LLARRELRENKIAWAFRDKYKLAPTDPRYLDATDLDMRLDFYMHLEHADNMKRLQGREIGHADTSASAVKGFEKALEAEGDGEMADEEFERVMRQEWDSADAVTGTQQDPAHQALKELLGDRYHPEDFRLDEEFAPRDGDDEEEG
jgi:hypothetical protein